MRQFRDDRTSVCNSLKNNYGRIIVFIILHEYIILYRLFHEYIIVRLYIMTLIETFLYIYIMFTFFYINIHIRKLISVKKETKQFELYCNYEMILADNKKKIQR